jgi:hypothetical protein
METVIKWRTRTVKKTNLLFILLLLAGTNTVMSSTYPVTLNYDAEAYAYAYAEWVYVDFYAAHNFSTNREARVGVIATAPGYDFDNVQYSYTRTTIIGVYDITGVQIVSTIKGDGCRDGTEVFEWGGGSGNGYTSLVGTIEIGYAGDMATLTADADVVVTEITPSDPLYYNLDWWLKIWDDDPDNPLTLLNENNMLANLNVPGGQLLNIEFYHEAGIEQYAGWPETEEGMSSIVTIDLTAIPEPATLLLFTLAGLALLRRGFHLR